MNQVIRRRGDPAGALREAPPGRGRAIVRPMAGDESGIRKLEVPKMVQYVRHYVSDPTLIQLARRITQLCEAKDKLCEMNALFLWTKNHIRYVNDPLQNETIATPKFHLAEIMTPPEVIRTILTPIFDGCGHSPLDGLRSG